MQEVWDSKGMSIEWHNYMLKQLFGHLLPNENVDNVNYKDGIGALIRKMPLDWIDDLEGPPSTPTSFKRLIGLYKKWGLVEPKRWRMCLGTKEYSHEPLILPPAEEDSYDRNKIIKCSCVPPKGKSTCPECATHCTHCGKARTEMIAFHYLPIANQLSSIMESKSLCYKMLTIWRNRHDWLTTTAAPQKIKHFWDGEKVREYQDFWNPRSQWELPITCPNDKCRMLYCSFPTKCEELIHGWNNELGCYNFSCWRCKTSIKAPRVFESGDPRNIALGAHWDGFNVSGKKRRGCWAMEISVLNAGTASSISLLPVLFIPLGGHEAYTVARMKENISAFVQPFVEELEDLFLDGITCQYNYPCRRISNILQNSETPKIIVILMLLTGDHPAQYKISNLKSSGKSGCRRCKMDSTQNADGRYIYGNNEWQAQHPPPRRSAIELHESVRKWRALKNDKEARTQHSMESGVSGDF